MDQVLARADSVPMPSVGFETLLLELSTRFIDLPAHEVDGQIQSALNRVCEFLGLERSTLWQAPEDGENTFVLTHIHQPGDAPQPPAAIDARDYFPWVLQRVRRDELTTITALDELPPDAAQDLASFRHFATKSTVILPLSIGGAVAGALSFATVRASCAWPSDLVQMLQLLAQIFAQAIARARDDHALRAREAQLDESARQWQETFDAIGDAILLLDPNRRIVRANAAAATSVGLPLDQVIGQPCNALVHGESWDGAGCPFAQSVESGVAHEAEILNSFRGTHCQYTVHPMPAGSARHIAAICVCKDVSAHKRIVRELSHSREGFALAAAGASDGLWDWNIVSDEAYYSPRWKSMLGYGLDEIPDTLAGWNELVHPEDRARALATLQAYIHSETGLYELEHRLRHKDGSYRWILSRGKVLRDTNGRPYRMAGSHTDITERKEAEEQLRQAFTEMNLLRGQLQEQNVYLREEVRSLSSHARLVGNSSALNAVLAQVAQVASTNATVLLLGETGTGKELLAAEIHELSPRSQHLMVRVNCSAIPAALIESELFGREKGAYTGALSKQIGRFELANGSTLFLDEVGELPLDMQAKLLRALEQRQIERLGSPRPISIDVRIIAATNQDLERLVREGKFRQDLYFRLNVFPITLPPLRKRPEDIAMLVSAFVSEFGATFGKDIQSIDRESLEALQRYSWPGNIRELRNVVERAMIMAQGPRLRIGLPGAPAGEALRAETMREAERNHILRILALAGGRIRGQGGAAQLLDLKPTTLESRMTRLGIKSARTSQVRNNGGDSVIS